MPNRLSDATSPYLRQHAENPVDWWPWCEEAFADARERDVPVLLSVGYAACHWCHVMAHESFEDPRTADLMNERFVAIKVDREERPDIDAVYMAATQVLTGSGGWPMTVMLDHDGHAFYAGTYFPPVPRPGMPSFTQVLVALDEAWRTDRARVATAASRLHETLSGQTVTTTGGTAPTRADVAGAVGALARDFDTDRGGFGGAPKFPPSPVLEFLLRAHALGAGSAPDAPALQMAADTMTAMARGGIYDQLGGGFARYSVDADWVVPHFEKMLYDNAQLLRCYVHWWRATGDPLARRVAEETARFLLAELRTTQGGFASSLDADSEGREGAFYVWTPAELEQALEPADASWVARLCEVTTAGTFEAGASVLQLRADPPDPARWQRCRAALAAARDARAHPARDDKVVAAWNGLAIAGLAEAGALLDLPELVDAATRCAEHLRAVHWGPDRRLLRVSLAGQSNPDAGGVLEDYADLAEGLLALYQVTGEERWYRWSGELLDVVLEQFGDGRGGFFDTASDAPALVRRPQDPTDGVAASGWSAAVQAMVTFAALSGETRFRDSAERANATLLALAQRNPRFTGWTWAAITAVLAGPVQVAIVFPEPERTGPHTGPSLHEGPHGQHEAAFSVPSTGATSVPSTGATSVSSTADPGSVGPVPWDARGHDLLVAALLSTSPGLVVAAGVEGRSEVPLLRDRPCVDGMPTAYPCRGFVCDLPVTSVEDLRGSIAR